MAAAVPELWQFRFSHFNEKARWALDWKGVPHRRRSFLPGPHMLPVLWGTGQKQVPVLVLDGKVIPDSTAIIAALEAAYPERPLYPADPALRARALALEEFFDTQLGPHIRRAFFYDLLPHTEWAASAMSVGFGPAARFAYRAFFPVTRFLMRTDMRIDTSGAELGRAKTLEALDRIEAEIEPSGYLVGDAFSVADLTAAALLAPLTTPPEFSYVPPGPLPEPIATFRASLAQRPAFRWAEEMFRRHRGTSKELPA